GRPAVVGQRAQQWVGVGLVAGRGQPPGPVAADVEAQRRHGSATARRTLLAAVAGYDRATISHASARVEAADTTARVIGQCAVLNLNHTPVGPNGSPAIAADGDVGQHRLRALVAIDGRGAAVAGEHTVLDIQDSGWRLVAT